jgi:hypothetical protein
MVSGILKSAPRAFVMRAEKNKIKEPFRNVCVFKKSISFA